MSDETVKSESTEISKESPVNLTEHLPLIITLASTFFIAIRILSVADYNVETGFAILQYGGTASILIGVLISTIGQLCPIIATLCFIALREQRLRVRTYEKHGLIITGVFFTISSFFFASIVNLIAISLLPPIAYGISSLRLRSLKRRNRKLIERGDVEQMQSALEILERKLERTKILEIRTGIGTIISIGAVLAIIGLTTSPWLPTERLTFTNGKYAEFGYMLSTSDTEDIFLNADTRQLEFLNANTVKNRFICSSNSLAGDESLPTLLNVGPKYPDC